MMARKRHKGLSERQRKILEVLEQFQDKNGYPPSIREICDQTGITSTSVVNYYLEQLQEMGHIQREDRVSRGIRLVNPLSEILGTAEQVSKKVKQALDELVQIPITGRIVASLPVPVPGSDFNYFDSEHAVSVARNMLPGRVGKEDLYALEVQGDSMIDAMVNDGDIVIMRRANDARNGEMVAVWLTDRDETTLKYFYRENGRIRLQPANPTMAPIIIEDNPNNLQIQGKVVMVIRQVDHSRPN